MAQENWQKIKLVKLVDLLRRDTDAQHPLTTKQLCSRLEQMNIPCDRRTLSKDIALLNDQGMEVLWVWVDREKGYYIDDRSFSVPELKILIDAVQAASFITPKKTDELIGKIAALGGSHEADILRENTTYFNTRKHSNESIYYSVDALESALRQGKKVIFRYFDLGADGQKVYRRDGHHYVVEPVALVFNEDNYYAVVYSAKHDNTANYRVDRMDSVEVIDDDISEKALELRSQVAEYTEQAIKMYGGPMETVVLAFDKVLAGAVFDRFGGSVQMSVMDGDENRYTATVRVQISPTFWGWLFQFGKKMRVISPEEVVSEYRERLEEMLEWENTT